MKNTFKLCLLMALLGVMVYTSCTKSTKEAPVTPPTEVQVTDQSRINNQVELLLGSWNNVFPNAGFQPLGMSNKSVIANEAQRQSIIASIVSEGSNMVTFDGTNEASLKLHTIKDAPVTGFRTNLEAWLQTHLKTGMGVADLRWKSAQGEFVTRIVYDNNGIVYDNIVAQIAIVKTDAAAKTYTITNLTITWVWGGERGKINISHTIDCSGGTRLGSYGNSNAYMSLGEAKASIVQVGTTSSSSRTTWGWAWGTPGITVSVSYSNGKVTASASGSLGSKGAADGFNNMYCP
jgi:hypothetical protein